jgi:ABC-type transport system substrate-binding protein
MNYGELKTNIKALAFEDDDTILEYEENDVIPTAINRSITILADTVLPIVKSYEVSLDGDDTDYLFFDMSALTDDFLAFDTHPVRIDDGDVYKAFGEYTIEGNDTLVIPGNVRGTVKIFYKASHTPYVPGTGMDEVELPLKRRIHHLVPLLAAYYVWLDDDPTKAAQYFNQYETASAAVINSAEQPRARILEGGL